MRFGNIKAICASSCTHVLEVYIAKKRRGRKIRIHKQSVCLHRNTYLRLLEKIEKKMSRFKMHSKYIDMSITQQTQRYNH